MSANTKVLVSAAGLIVLLIAGLLFAWAVGDNDENPETINSSPSPSPTSQVSPTPKPKISKSKVKPKRKFPLI